MTNSETVIRDIAEKTFPLDAEELYNSLQRLYRSELIERITALISEHYTANEEVNQEVEKRIAERMPSEKVDAIIERINEDVEKPMVTAQFGDMWKSHAIEHYNLPDIVNIAWRQGRRALLLEKELRSRLTNPGDSQKTEGGGE